MDDQDVERGEFNADARTKAGPSPFATDSQHPASVRYSQTPRTLPPPPSPPTTAKLLPSSSAVQEWNATGGGATVITGDPRPDEEEDEEEEDDDDDEEERGIMGVWDHSISASRKARRRTRLVSEPSALQPPKR